jgi:hypothetical protein
VGVHSGDPEAPMIDHLMDERACYGWLVGLLHPAGLVLRLRASLGTDLGR